MNTVLRALSIVTICLSLALNPLLSLTLKAQDGGSASPSFLVHTGEFTSPDQQDIIPLEIKADDFTMTSGGSVLLGFLLRAAEGSAVNPGLIDVTPHEHTQPQPGGPKKPDIAGSLASLTLTEVSVGLYNTTVRSEQGTVGAYVLEIFLAGDANGDFQVDQHDLDQIAALHKVKWNEPGYLPSADVDRNGVINGGDTQWASRNLGASTSLRLEVENPVDQFLEAGALSLVGVSPNTFNALSVPLQFTLSGAEFYQSIDEVKLTINGVPVPSTNLVIEPHTITATSVLVDGKNEVSFVAVDTLGRPLYFQTTLWAGSNILQVNLYDENGLPFTETADVVASLTDDQSVFVQGSTTGGSISFQNVPSRTILIQASASNNRFGHTGVLGWEGQATIRMLGFGTPSEIDNNDFSQGTAGWNIGSAPVWIVTHVEGVPGSFAAVALSEAATEGAQRGTPPMAVAPEQPAAFTSPDSSATSIVDDDLLLATAGEGEQLISRTFNTDPGTSAVRIRYRFITSEVPGGWFGSEYNDYFRVSLRSQQAGGIASESNSMNGLGLAAFDYASGATNWRDITLQLNPEGDTIQVDVAVANVGDALYNSQVVIDFVAEVRDQVRPSLTWNNTLGGLNLSYRVENGALTQDTPIEVYWANGTGYANRLGAPIFTHNVPAGTAEGEHGPIHIAGNLLAADPAGVTHLIAASSETSVGSLADVQVNFGANANPAVVWANMIDVMKDGLREAGQANATINSTARTPTDQARVMFINLVNPDNPINVNVANQLGIYAPPGDAVINVFVNQTAGMTHAEIIANQTAIRAAMEDEINNQGPSNVSRHCADPAEVNVVDVGSAVFNANNIQRFVDAVQGRVNRLIDERDTNGCFHLELE